MYPLFLPHLKHLLTTLVENFGCFADFAICDDIAIFQLVDFNFS